MQQVGLSVGDTGRAKQRREFFIRMQIPGAQRHRPFGMTDEGTGRRTNGRQPICDVLGVPDRGGKQQQSSLSRTEDQRLLPDYTALRIRQVLRFIHDHQAQGVQAHVDFASRCIVQEVSQDLRGHDEQGGLGMFPSIAGEDSHLPRTEQA